MSGVPQPRQPRELVRALARAEDRWLDQARVRLERAAADRGDTRPRRDHGRRTR